MRIKSFRIALLIFLFAFISSAYAFENPISSINKLSIFGVDYAPGHYPNNDRRNDENQANVYAEMQQLKSAGYRVVRLYGDPGKTWIAVINAAKQLNMQVVYQVAICESNASGTCVHTKNSSYQHVETLALQQLTAVIGIVGKPTFQKIVRLIIVGNEVLWQDGQQTNAKEIIGTINKVKTLLHTNGLDIPLTVSLQADVWIQSQLSGRMQIAKALPPGDPIAINVYPFQWVVPVEHSMNPKNPHSLPYYVNEIKRKYKRPIIISETGWATQGKYYLGKNRTIGSLDNAAKYYPKVYDYAKKNDIPVLTFMAYDTPTKDLGHPNMTSENFYGVFNDNCQLKDKKILVPNKAYTPTPACNTKQALFTFVGGSNTKQPEFSITVIRDKKTLYTLNAPTQNRTSQALTPWPTVTLQAKDSVILKSKQHHCQNTVSMVNESTHAGGTWRFQHPKGCPETNWPARSQVIYLDAKF